MSTSDSSTERPRDNFIYDIIDEDLERGTYGDRVVTRFPPEPNGYLHIGHAKSIVLNFGIKHDYADRADTRCHLRFDDTNPDTESTEYVESIKEAVQWLGYDWEEHEYHASDYFEQFYQYAVTLIQQGDAYVDSLSEEEIREYRGTVDEPGTPSPYRDRSVEKNLKLFRKMKAGEFDDGEHVLRAKIDMGSPHMIMRDPLLFRIKHAHHYPRQYEFNRLNLGYTVMSKTKLRHLIEEDLVGGWDDPRLPTISGLRRRGVPPSAIRSFCRTVGVTRSQSRVQIGHFEHALRDDLNAKAPRVMAVLDPLKVVATNVDADTVDWIDANHWPRDIDKDETRPVPFTREFYIERDDFREDPPEDFIRLAPGREVRLRHAYFFTCEEIVRDEDGVVTELRGTIDLETRDSTAPDGRSPEGTLHWVSAAHGLPFEARLYDRLFEVPDPDARDEHFTEFLNPDSLNVRQGILEPAVRDLEANRQVQFERQGYFWPDPETSRPDALVYNQIVPLRDTWGEDEDGLTQEELERRRRAKEQRKQEQRRRSLDGKTDPAEHLDDAQRDRFDRFHDELGIDREDAATIAGDDALAGFFEQALEHYDAPVPVANWTVNELLGRLQDQTVADLPFGPDAFAGLVRLVDTEVISTRGGDEVLDALLDDGGAPEHIVDDRGLRQVDDTEALRPTVQSVLDDHPDEVARYRDGKKGLIGFFMGQVMDATDGAASPELARELLQEELEPSA